MTKEAQLRAQKKYDDAHYNDSKHYHFKCNKVGDADIIEYLEAQPKKNTAIKEAIRAYMKGGN